MTTNTNTVWVQLYIGEKKKSGRVFSLEVNSNSIVDDLMKAVYQAKDKSLVHCNAADLLVYAPDTPPPFSEQTSIRGDKILKELIDELGNKNPRMSICYDHPLIVVAPAPAPHPPGQGKQLSCSRSPWNGKKRCCN